MKVLKTGQKITIEFFDNNKNIQSVNCTISDVDYDRLSLKYPDDKPQYIEFLKEGTTICAFIYTNGGIKVFKSIVLNEANENFLIEYPDEYENIQRREHIRVDWVNGAILVNRENESIKVVTLDIGAQAIRFKSPVRLKCGEKIKMRISLEKFLPSILIEGKIEKKEYYGDLEYLFRYDDLDAEIQNKIIKKCLEIHVCKMWD